jgi:hypothetical protein
MVWVSNIILVLIETHPCNCIIKLSQQLTSLLDRFNQVSDLAALIRLTSWMGFKKQFKF